MAGDPIVSVLVPGVPEGKKRHRARVVTPRGRKPWVQTYPDPAGVAYEETIAAAGREAMGGLDPLGEALTVLVEAFMPVPVSWSKKDRAAALAGDLHHTGKPDGDNICKAALDSLNKIAWNDDAQIVMLQTSKKYDEWPRLRISIWLFDDIPAAEPELL